MEALDSPDLSPRSTTSSQRSADMYFRSQDGCCRSDRMTRSPERLPRSPDKLTMKRFDTQLERHSDILETLVESMTGIQKCVMKIERKINNMEKEKEEDVWSDCTANNPLETDSRATQDSAHHLRESESDYKSDPMYSKFIDMKNYLTDMLTNRKVFPEERVIDQKFAKMRAYIDGAEERIMEGIRQFSKGDSSKDVLGQIDCIGVDVRLMKQAMSGTMDNVAKHVETMTSEMRDEGNNVKRLITTEFGKQNERIGAVVQQIDGGGISSKEFVSTEVDRLTKCFAKDVKEAMEDTVAKVTGNVIEDNIMRADVVFGEVADQYEKMRTEMKQVIDEKMNQITEEMKRDDGVLSIVEDIKHTTCEKLEGFSELSHQQAEQIKKLRGDTTVVLENILEKLKELIVLNHQTKADVTSNIKLSREEAKKESNGILESIRQQERLPEVLLKSETVEKFSEIKLLIDNLPSTQQNMLKNILQDGMESNISKLADCFNEEVVKTVREISRVSMSTLDAVLKETAVQKEQIGDDIRQTLAEKVGGCESMTQRNIQEISQLRNETTSAVGYIISESQSLIQSNKNLKNEIDQRLLSLSERTLDRKELVEGLENINNTIQQQVVGERKLAETLNQINRTLSELKKKETMERCEVEDLVEFLPSTRHLMQKQQEMCESIMTIRGKVEQQGDHLTTCTPGAGQESDTTQSSNTISIPRAWREKVYTFNKGQADEGLRETQETHQESQKRNQKSNTRVPPVSRKDNKSKKCWSP